MPKRHVSITDEEILMLFMAGKFIRQIKREHHVGLGRIRKVLDDAGLRNSAEAA
jgi:hypothetical protein